MNQLLDFKINRYEDNMLIYSMHICRWTSEKERKQRSVSLCVLFYIVQSVLAPGCDNIQKAANILHCVPIKHKLNCVRKQITNKAITGVGLRWMILVQCS